MRVRIKWVEGVSFLAETGSGHAIVVDGSPEAGGRNLGPRPMELVLAGTAACTAFDVVWMVVATLAAFVIAERSVRRRLLV